MAFPIIAVALGLAGFAPIIARWLGGGQAHETAAKVVDIAQKVTGASDPLEAIQRLQENTGMVSEFQKAIIDPFTDLILFRPMPRQRFCVFFSRRTTFSIPWLILRPFLP